MPLLNFSPWPNQRKVATAPNPPEHHNLTPAGSWPGFVLASIAAAALIISALSQNVLHALAIGGWVLGAAAVGASILGPYAWLTVLRGRGFGTRTAALILGIGCLLFAGVSSLGYVTGAQTTALESVSKHAESHADKRTLVKAAQAELKSLKGSRRDVLERRSELTALLVKLGEAKPSNQPVARLDSQGAALSFYLGKAGWTVSPADVTTWLALATVLFLECAAALSLTVAAALRPAPRPRPIAAPPAAVSAALPSVPAVPENATSKPAAKPERDDKDDAPPPPRNKGGRPRSVTRAEAVDRLKKAGGRVNGLGDVAKAVGARSRSTAHRLMHELASAGLVRLATGPRGLAVALA